MRRCCWLAAVVVHQLSQKEWGPHTDVNNMREWFDAERPDKLNAKKAKKAMKATKAMAAMKAMKATKAVKATKAMKAMKAKK